MNRLTLLHAANVTKLRLIFAILAGTGARLEPILLTDGARAALWGRSRRTCEDSHPLVPRPRHCSNPSWAVQRRVALTPLRQT